MAHAVGKAGTLLSEEQISMLVQDYLGGAQLRTLAEQYGIHRVTVREHLDRRNVTIRSKGLTDDAIDDAVHLYESGLSLATIGGRLGVTANTVRAGLLQRGVAMRSPNAPRRKAQLR